MENAVPPPPTKKKKKKKKVSYNCKLFVLRIVI